MLTHQPATQIMIKNFDVIPGASVLCLKWNSPKFLPYHYVLEYSLVQQSNGLVYSKTQILLDKETSHFLIEDVRPESFCTVTLRAAYNPAALDEGIFQFVTSDDSGEHQCIEFTSSFKFYVH